jgi:ArsR family transcriptional regulator, virulence genes transcriptional regulator
MHRKRTKVWEDRIMTKVSPIDEAAAQDDVIAALEGKAEQAARLLAALGQTKRLLALCNLLDREMSVGALAEAVGLSPSALSQHLARLRDIGVVATRREAQTVYYRLESDDARRLITLLYEIYCR